MPAVDLTASISPRLYSVSHTPSLSEFARICRGTGSVVYPLAAYTVSSVPHYATNLMTKLGDTKLEALKDEWHHILLKGPGVFVIKHLYHDQALLRRVNDVFGIIIEKERLSSRGDHFATEGKNDRIWNSFGKHALEDPSSFLSYYSNPWLAHICDAWLGPAYRITAQVNVIKPGGAAQVCHRDYHLGFQSAEACSRYPKSMQVASQLLTLQGAVAHTDMPLESGPTKLLPYSQQVEEGYMAYRCREFIEYFMAHHVSVRLDMGDGLFFNPALFHAAGENSTTDLDRSANLLQVSSAFGKPMENIDSIPLIEKCWNDLSAKYQEEGLSAEVRAFVSAVAEGYPFPTNLDRRPPAPGGMAPESEQDVVITSLRHGCDANEVIAALQDIRTRSSA